MDNVNNYYLARLWPSFFVGSRMTNWYEQKRASLLEVVVDQTTRAQAQGSSHGQYTLGSAARVGAIGGWFFAASVLPCRIARVCGDPHDRSTHGHERNARGSVFGVVKRFRIPRVLSRRRWATWRLVLYALAQAA